MAKDIRNVKNITDLISYFSQNLGWDVDIDDFDDIEDISYDFDAADIGLKEESFAKISSLRQLQPLVDGQQWGIFCVEFDSNKFEPSALKKILSGLIPRKRNSADHAVWCQQDLLFICNWGTDNNSTIGLAHFEDREGGLPQIKMFSCAPALEDFTQIKLFEERLAQLSWPKNTSKIDEWREVWSSAFTMAYKQTIQDSSTLTVQLAAEAQNIRNRILDILEVETKNGYVHKLFEKFRDTLIQDMTEQQFADMYAQTVVYGLFSARCLDETQEDFSVEEAIELLPNTNPFLKSLMQECFGANSKSKLSFDELEVGNVIDLLKHTKTDAIIQDFNRQTGGGKEDPVIHFYEEFLTAYDKAQKVQRGVFYTPQPVVNFIVRAVDSILKTEFCYEDGLATEATKTVKYERNSKKKVDGYYKKVEDAKEVPAVQILDPATGTGTFLRQTILQIYENFQEKHKGQPKEKTTKEWIEYVDRSLLPRLNGFELMMAPYAVAHMKLAMVLKDTGYDFSGNHRLNVFLTNSLEEAGRSDGQMTLWDDPLATESIEANEAKKNTSINIVLGNPPYSVNSYNTGGWITSLMEDYKKEPNSTEKLNERNPKTINDDYVKFIRYAQNIIESSGDGIIAFINPHGFLDNSTFRGMRWELLNKFDKIYIVNLHGNANKKEVCPDGGKDENVFDIKQGVSICFLIMNKKSKQRDLSEVYYYDLYGTREHKYMWLNNNSIYNIQQKIEPIYPPHYFMVPKNFTLKSSYEKGFSTNELFIKSTAGIVTANDKVLVADSVSQLLRNVKEVYNIDPDEKLVRKLSYRVFDTKLLYYDVDILDRPRTELMSQMKYKNIAFVTVRTQLQTKPTGYYFLSENPIVNGYIRSDSVSIDNMAPLFIYSNFLGEENRVPNLNDDIVYEIADRVGIIYEPNGNGGNDNILAPIDLFDYIYAVLHSVKYRDTYSEFLKIDFPRIPYPTCKNNFWKLVELGEKLRKVHLLDSLSQECITNEFIGEGDNIVEKPKYFDGKIYINKAQYFNSVSETIWNFYIGGYQPLQKWLKDRKGIQLSVEDIIHYQKMVFALAETNQIMKKIDLVIEI